MKQEILDKYGLTEAEFYKKYPTEAAFKKAHPEDFKAMKKTFAKGGKLPEGILKARLESHMSPEEVNDYIANYASGGMIKRADGSYSQRGLWDNIRANKGSGKKPTKEMLKQEAKIRAQEKAMGGYMYAEGGKLPTEILRARLESHMSSDEAQDYINEYGKGGYTVTRSNDRKGKTHKVTGPDGTVKYFGDSKLGQHPNDPKRKKAFYARHAKNLKNNPYFRAFARATWAEGGYIDQYGKGGFWDDAWDVVKDIGAGAYGIGEGILDTVTFGATDELTDKGYKALQELGGSTESEIKEQDAIRGFGNTAGAVGGALINPAATGSAIAEGAEGLGAGISNAFSDSEAAQTIGQGLSTAGNITGMFMGNVGSGTAQAAKFAGSGFGKAANVAGKVGKGYNMALPFMSQQGYNAKGGFMPSTAGTLEGFTYAYGGELVDLEGPKHSEGGIMLTNNAEVEGGETKLGNYIYSDQLEVPGKKGVTFAKESKRIKNKYKLRKGGDIYDRQQEMLELMDLQDMNEEARIASEAEEAFEMAKGGWIKKATESIKKRGTEGVCTGSKFGGPTCPPGSKRYNLAKTFRKMAKARKHAEGGFVGELYDMGGEIQKFGDGSFLPTPTGEAITSSFPNSPFATGLAEDGGGVNWMNIAGAAAPLVLGSVGQIFGTTAQNKPLKRQLKELKERGYDKVDYGTVNYERIKPVTLDPTQALLETEREARVGRKNAEMAGAGNLATMFANKQMADAMAMKQKAKTVGEYENANRAIQNAAAERNAAIAQAEQEMNKKLQVEAAIDEAKNKGQYYTDIAALETAIGANRAAGWKGAFGSGSESASNLFSNKQMLDAMMALYNNPESQKTLKGFRLFGK